MSVLCSERRYLKPTKCCMLKPVISNSMLSRSHGEVVMRRILHRCLSISGPRTASVHGLIYACLKFMTSLYDY